MTKIIIERKLYGFCITTENTESTDLEKGMCKIFLHQKVSGVLGYERTVEKLRTKTSIDLYRLVCMLFPNQFGSVKAEKVEIVGKFTKRELKKLTNISSVVCNRQGYKNLSHINQ